MTQTPDNGYAPGVVITPMMDQGISLRDYFAGQALIMLPQMGSASKLKPIELAQDAYLMADAMIAARKVGAQ